MAMPSDNMNYVAEDEFLATEELSDAKHEWVDGYTFAMAGATKAHGDCVTNCVGTLFAASRRKGCRLIAADLLVRTGRAYYYPDVVLTCESSADPRIEHQPCLIIEVGSPSTLSTDKREKLFAYMQIATLVDYWIVDLRRGSVEVHHREIDGWVHSIATAGDIVSATCIETEVAVDDILAGITIPPPDPADLFGR